MVKRGRDWVGVDPEILVPGVPTWHCQGQLSVLGSCSIVQQWLSFFSNLNQNQNPPSPHCIALVVHSTSLNQNSTSPYLSISGVAVLNCLWKIARAKNGGFGRQGEGTAGGLMCATPDSHIVLTTMHCQIQYIGQYPISNIGLDNILMHYTALKHCGTAVSWRANCVADCNCSASIDVHFSTVLPTRVGTVNQHEGKCRGHSM